MGRWLDRVRRGLPLTLLLLLAAALPGAGLVEVAPAGPVSGLVVPAAAAAQALDRESNGLIEQHTARPLLTASATLSTAQLLEAELHPAKAPVPTGPVTYVPILMYHYIRINPHPRDVVGFGLSTPPAMFRLQMQYLANRGFHVISLHQAVLAIKAHSGLPSRPVVLSFDDGYADFFTAAIPIMLSHGFTATDFVISGRMGQSSFMTPSQVVAADSMGFTIGAHTVDHVALAGLSPARASWEIRTSKAMLETLLGHRVDEFAYPYGSFNAYDMAQVQSAGFESAASTLYGTIHSPGQLYYLSRMRIGGGLSLAYFAAVVGGPSPNAADLHGLGAVTTSTPGPSSKPAATPTPTPTPAPTVTGAAAALSVPRRREFWL